MINNRQAGRRRGRGGNNGPGGGGGGNNGGGQRQGRGDNGNRIDSRARGNASQLYEKYKNMASDAQRQGDRVTTEYYLQFADHYFRVISDQRGRFEEQPRRDRDDFDADGFNGNADDFGDEGEPIRAGEQQMEQRGDRDDSRDQRPAREPRGDRDQRPEREARDQNGRSDREHRPEREPRGDREPRSDRESRDREPRADRPDRAPREDREPRPRYDDQRPRERTVVAEVAGQHRADPIEPGESLHARAEAILEADVPLAARRRGRPRRDASEAKVEQPADVEGAGDSPSLDADRLPPSLMMPANDADGDAPKPRRRRVRSPAAEPDAAE